MATAYWTCSGSSDERPVERGPYCRKHFVAVFGEESEKEVSDE